MLFPLLFSTLELIPHLTLARPDLDVPQNSFFLSFSLERAPRTDQIEPKEPKNTYVCFVRIESSI